MQPAPATKAVPARRRLVRTDGTQSLADVARLACGDVRLAALLHDLNPALPLVGRLRSGTEVVCPARSESQAFAKKMDFAIGIVEGGPSGTGARRLWAAHVGEPRPPAYTGPEALARALLGRGVAPAEAGRRVAAQCTQDGALDAIRALARHPDHQLRAVGSAAELCALYPTAKRRLHAVRSVLQATGRPGGLRAMLEACCRSPNEADRVLSAAAVAAPLRAALLEEAPRAGKLLERARRLVQLERGARDAELRVGGGALAGLVAALVDGVEPFAGDRLAALGLCAEAEALEAHAAQLDVALSMADAALARTPDAIRALAYGTEAAALARPWPLVAAVCRELAKPLELLASTAHDDGLGGLVPRVGSRTSAEGAPVLLSVAELQARAAACSRKDDEGDALAVRLCPSVVELFALLRSAPALDGGPANARVARRRSAFDLALAARGEVSADGTATLVIEALERARESGMPGAHRLTRAQIEAAAQVARGLPASLSVLRRPMSELGRAMVVAAMALDRDIGQGLARPTGCEALSLSAQRHAARVLSAASCRIAAGA